MFKKEKIKVNDNLTTLLNFINSAEHVFKYSELVQFVIDYDLYKEFYLNHSIICKLFDEKIKELNDLKGDSK